jgi:hypothetical protein
MYFHLATFTIELHSLSQHLAVDNFPPVCSSTKRKIGFQWIRNNGLNLFRYQAFPGFSANRWQPEMKSEKSFP